jgi:hypothetical protein
MVKEKERLLRNVDCQKRSLILITEATFKKVLLQFATDQFALCLLCPVDYSFLLASRLPHSC